VRRLRSAAWTRPAGKLEKTPAAGVSALPGRHVARERVQALWRQAFELLMQLESLERAVEAAARDLDAIRTPRR